MSKRRRESPIGKKTSSSSSSTSASTSFSPFAHNPSDNDIVNELLRDSPSKVRITRHKPLFRTLSSPSSPISRSSLLPSSPLPRTSSLNSTSKPQNSMSDGSSDDDDDEESLRFVKARGAAQKSRDRLLYLLDGLDSNQDKNVVHSTALSLSNEIVSRSGNLSSTPNDIMPIYSLLISRVSPKAPNDPSFSPDPILKATLSLILLTTLSTSRSAKTFFHELETLVPFLARLLATDLATDPLFAVKNVDPSEKRKKTAFSSKAKMTRQLSELKVCFDQVLTGLDLGGVDLSFRALGIILVFLLVKAKPPQRLTLQLKNSLADCGAVGMVALHVAEFGRDSGDAPKSKKEVENNAKYVEIEDGPKSKPKGRKHGFGKGSGKEEPVTPSEPSPPSDDESSSNSLKHQSNYPLLPLNLLVLEYFTLSHSKNQEILSSTPGFAEALINLYHHRCELDALLRVLINLTAGDARPLFCTSGMLELIVSWLIPKGGQREHSDDRDTALLTIGLLINLLDYGPTQDLLRRVQTRDGTGVDGIVDMYIASTALKSDPTPKPSSSKPHSRESNDFSAQSTTIKTTYLAVLIGCLIRNHPQNQSQVRKRLPTSSFVPLKSLIENFLDIQSDILNSESLNTDETQRLSAMIHGFQSVLEVFSGI